MANEVGSGQVAIEPVFTGFRSKVTNEVETSGRDGGKTFGQAFRGALVGLGTLIGIDKLKDSFVDSIEGAGNLEQSVGGVQAVFKDASGTMFEYAANAKTALGLTKNEYNELGTVIGSQLKNGGVAMDELAPKTNQLISLGGDLSAQFGGSTKEAVEALSSALKGERDPIERYGVSLNQSKIDAEAAALGYEKVGGAFEQQAQQAATLSLVMKQTADAQGAAARETTSFNSRQATFNAIVKEGKAAVAGAFLPALSSLYGFMNERLPGAFDKASLKAAAFGGFLTVFLAKMSAFQAGIASGAGSIDLTAALGIDPNSGFGQFAVQAMDSIRRALDGVREAAGPAFASLRAGDFSGLSGIWEAFLAIARPTGPILVEVGKAVGALSAEIGKIIASGLPLLKPLLEGAAGVMQFLAQNTGILTAAVIALAAGMVVWRLAQIAGNIAALASVPVAAAQAASNFALAAAIRGQTAATVVDTAATAANTGSRLASIGTFIATTAAMVASRVAQLAGAAATGVATAAQWAWNAALSANPIGIVIVAVMALVAALVYFFTETEAGRAIFQAVFSYIQNTVDSVLGWFTGTLVPTFQRVWSTIESGLSTLSSFFTTTWSSVKSGVSGFIGEIVQYFSGLPNKITGALGDLGTLLLGSGQALIQGFISGIESMVGAIGEAVGGVLEFARSFFPNSPAKRGPFSGKGYTSFSGQDLARDFAGGIASQQVVVSRAASGLMSAASLGMSGGVSISGASASSTGTQAGRAVPTVNLNGPIHVRDENELARTIQKTQLDALAVYR